MTVDVLGLILGGGAGARLYPLTKLRAKPAVPIAGKYRLVDIPLSNCLNSGIDYIYVLTQFNSVSLHRHITQTYHLDLFARGWVQILAAEQTPRSHDWYQGTADAVRKQLPEIRAAKARDVLILSGDHLYRMDYRPFIETHRASRADITLAVQPVGPAEASRFGLVRTDPAGRITAFHEKTRDPAQLAALAVNSDAERPYLASMGVYLFRAEVLERLLEDESGADFGRHILPAGLTAGRMQSYRFTDYWADLGTIRAFFDANLALAAEQPAFSLYDAEYPIYTHPRPLPPSRVDQPCVLRQVLLSEGCHIHSSELNQAVIGVRSQIGPGARLTRVIMMGADEYESPAERARMIGQPVLGVGAGAVIEDAILDKNARIGARARICGWPGRPDEENGTYAVRDGLVIVMKNAVIPAGTVI